MILAWLLLVFLPGRGLAQKRAEHQVQVSKVEPPSWWIGITPDVMVLLSGRNLQATKVSCNIPTVKVNRTQASAAGAYLFVWLKIGMDTRSGTAVCRVETPLGDASFELALGARDSPIGKFQGLSPGDIIYGTSPRESAKEVTSGVGSLQEQLSDAGRYLTALKELGFTALALGGIGADYDSQKRHHGGTNDFYWTDENRGVVQDVEGLVASAHERGLKVLLNTELNHTSAEHPWISNPPTPDWFHGTRALHRNATVAEKDGGEGQDDVELERLVDPHAPARATKNLTEGWIENILPDLNTENPLVSQYLLQNSIWWAEKTGIDGYILEDFPYVPRKFWANWHAGLRRIYPAMTTIGEVADGNPDVLSFFAGGQKRFDGIDSSVSTVLDYPLNLALRDVLSKDVPAGNIVEVLRHDSLYPQPNALLTFWEVAGASKISGKVEEALAEEPLALGLLLTLRGIPKIDNLDAATWKVASTAKVKDFDQEARSYVRTLLKVRHEHPVMALGKLWHLAVDEKCYVFGRDLEEEKVVVAFNNGRETRELKISLKETFAEGKSGLSLLFGKATGKIQSDELQLKMPAKSLSVLQIN